VAPDVRRIAWEEVSVFRARKQEPEEAASPGRYRVELVFTQ
jgi:hypothetical protein